MERQFNTAGPSVSGDHYMIDPLSRVDVEELLGFIDAKRYFVLHAPRQTGKTTCLLALMHQLNQGGRYRALYVNIEAAQAVRQDVARGMRAITGAIASAAALYLEDRRLLGWTQEALEAPGPDGALTELLARWSQHSDRPLVLMLDEVDALVGDTLISLLRQIRAGYPQRPAAFPQTVLLCGVRDVRDYRIHSGGGEIITGGSAFNIKAASIRLGNFSRDEVATLFAQHTADTGQVFADGVLDEVWADSQGQPWLVNALGHEATWIDREARRDRTLPITLERYRAARERLIHSRATHLDQLADKLKEDRVRRVIAPLLESQGEQIRFREDDLQYVEDLGLIRRKPEVGIANRIYQEVIPRELTSPIQDGLHQPTPWYIGPDHRLDLPKLLSAFQQFFREHADAWLERYEYKEAGPQLLLQAFLQRIINGGGRLNREYGLGRRRTDLFLEWPLDEAQGFHGPVQRVVLELKLLHKSLELTLQEGLAQTHDYADRCGADEAHLLIFDRRPGIAWEEKIWQREEGGLSVWGL
jgi:hypothetical protein